LRGRKTSMATVVAVMVAYASEPDNMSAVARLAGVPESTCRNIVKKYKNDEKFAKLREDSARAMTEKIDDVMNLAYQNLFRELSEQFMRDEKEKKEVTLSDLTRTFGILLDKKAAIERENKGLGAEQINVTFNDYG